MENPTRAYFKEYEDINETVPIYFTEDDMTWIASKLSGAEVMLGAEEIELCNWIILFGCA